MTTERTQRRRRRQGIAWLPLLLTLAFFTTASATVVFYGDEIQTTIARFTDRVSSSNRIETGVLKMKANNVADDFLTLTNMLPGDSISDSVIIENAGTVPFDLTVSVSAADSNLLVTDPENGLQLRVATTDQTLYEGPLGGAETHPLTVDRGDSVEIFLSVTLPMDAGNEFQGLANDLTFHFTAEQQG